LAFSFGLISYKKTPKILTFGLYYPRPNPKAKAKSTYLDAFMAYKPKSKSHK
jgi:hypothetical protein